jgi:hypothetical protein
MYEFDFVSVVFGYVAGVLLCYSITHVIFVEKDDESE